MEFRKCPACEASVLDDDAAECPFCGASMSGKPTAATAKPASQKPATKPAEKSTARQPTGKAAAGKQLARRSAVAEQPSAVDDDDPFDVDTSVVAQAPPVAPRPAKGRMIRIVCPMCETPGFIAPKMRGRDVKCCNPDCLVPVFQAPRPEKQAEPEEESRRFVSAKTVVLGSAVILPLIAIIVFFSVYWDGGPKPYVSPPAGATSAADDVQDVSPPEPGDASPRGNPVKAKISLSEIQRQALELSEDAARERGENRSKPYCRRQAAEAYAQVGDLKKAQQQIKQLQVVTREPFYRIEPLVEIAWQQLNKGDRSAAEKTINEAVDAARGFPPVGRPAAAAAASLAAVLAAVGRIDDGQAVLRRLDRDDDKAIYRERVAALVQITNDLKIFDLDRVLRFSSLDMASDPLAVATTVLIAAHQQWESAIAWANAVKDAAAREDCFSALAVVAARWSALKGDASAVSAVTEAAAKLSVTGRAREAAGVATGALMGNDRDAATAALQKGMSLFEGIPRPEAIPRPTVKLIHDDADDRIDRFSNTASLRSAAVGVAQMARLQSLLGDNDAAWSTLLEAWEFTKGIGPEFAGTSALVDEIDNNRRRAEQRVRRELGIANQDLGDRAFANYGRQLRHWGEAAEKRFDLEVSLLHEALKWGLVDNVAQVVADPPAVISSAVGQRYASSYLVSALKERYAAAGDDAKAREMEALESPSRRKTSDRIARLIAQSDRLFQEKKYNDAATLLGGFRGRQDTEQLRDLQAMQLACRMLKLNDPDEYFPFILALHDPVLTEDCFEMTAALAVGEGMAPDLWERYRPRGLSATQRVAFFRGLIAGIVAAGASSQSGDTQTAAVSQPSGVEAD